MAVKGTSLYIHIPFCLSKCAYCDFFSRPQINAGLQSVSQSYIEALCKEIAFRLSENKVSSINTIYVGGGTPSLLAPDQFVQLFTTIRINSALASDAEITVEVNPDDLTSQLLTVLAECGVNRISCGIQSMKDQALKKACRRADARTNRRALSLLASNWKGQLSLDFISGLPEDDEESLLSSLKEACDLNPSHISLYSLSIEENTPFGKQLHAGTLAYDFDKADALWLAGRDFLESQGYKWYEVSNFCRPEKACRHNLCYWSHGDYIGAGSGATGTLYKKGGAGFRWTNSTNIEEYIDFWLEQNRGTAIPQITENIDLSTSEFEFFMMGLRKLRGILDRDFEKIFGKPLAESFCQTFDHYEKKGLCVRSSGEEGTYYAMSREGMLFLNRFLEELC